MKLHGGSDRHYGGVGLRPHRSETQGEAALLRMDSVGHAARMRRSIRPGVGCQCFRAARRTHGTCPVAHHLLVSLTPRPRHQRCSTVHCYSLIRRLVPSPSHPSPQGTPTPSTVPRPWTAQPPPRPAQGPKRNLQQQLQVLLLLHQPRRPQWGSHRNGRGRRPQGRPLERPQVHCRPHPWPAVEGRGQGRGLWGQGRWRRSVRRSGGWWRGSGSSGSSWCSCVRVGGRVDVVGHTTKGKI